MFLLTQLVNSVLKEMLHAFLVPDVVLGTEATVVNTRSHTCGPYCLQLTFEPHGFELHSST